MNLYFIKTFKDFEKQLENGEIVISQESSDSEDRMFWYKENEKIKMVTSVAQGIFAAEDGKLEEIFEMLEPTLLYVVKGAKIIKK